MLDPLTIDRDIESLASKRNETRFRRALKWLNNLVPLRIYYEQPYGRASLEAGLKARPFFPASEWERNGVAAEEALKLLRVLEKELNLPNPHFIPDDPVSLAFTPDYDDLPLESVRLGIRETFGFEFGSKLIYQAYNDNWDLGQLFEVILARVRHKTTEQGRAVQND